MNLLEAPLWVTLVIYQILATMGTTKLQVNMLTFPYRSGFFDMSRCHIHLLHMLSGAVIFQKPFMDPKLLF